MQPIVLALASNEALLPGLYCAVASALSTWTGPESEFKGARRRYFSDLTGHFFEID